MKQILTVRNFSKHKRRFDRGGIYLNYLTILITGGTFLKVFGVEKYWWLGVISVILFRYISGLIDDLSGILRNEQSQYSKQNPVLTEILEKLDELKEKS